MLTDLEVIRCFTRSRARARLAPRRRQRREALAPARRIGEARYLAAVLARVALLRGSEVYPLAWPERSPYQNA